MGYRSNVRVMTDHEGFEKMREIAWKLAEEKGLSDEVVLFPKPDEDANRFYEMYDEGDDYVCFGLDWVKWYDSYRDVDLFMSVLFEADYEGVRWQFVRIGEDYNDVETEVSSTFYDNAPVVMHVQTEVSY